MTGGYLLRAVLKEKRSRNTRTQPCHSSWGLKERGKKGGQGERKWKQEEKKRLTHFLPCLISSEFGLSCHSIVAPGSKLHRKQQHNTIEYTAKPNTPQNNAHAPCLMRAITDNANNTNQLTETLFSSHISAHSDWQEYNSTLDKSCQCLRSLLIIWLWKGLLRMLHHVDLEFHEWKTFMENIVKLHTIDAVMEIYEIFFLIRNSYHRMLY